MNRRIDGFGRYGGTKSYMLNGSSGQAWAQVDFDFSLSNANPRTGSWHLRQGTNSINGVVARRVFGAPLTEVWLGKAIYCHALPANEHNFAGGGIPEGSNLGVCLFGLRVLMRCTPQQALGYAFATLGIAFALWVITGTIVTALMGFGPVMFD